METIDEDSARSGILEAVQSFTGQIEQIPPMYSALKVDGMKLVNAARKGVVVERKPRRVTIHSIDEITISDDLLQVQFTVCCSKGTYVRTLCEDIGKKLGVPACMEELERTRAAGLSVESAYTLAQVEALKQAGRLEECVIPTDEFLTTYPALVVTDDAIKKLIFGNYLYDVDFQDGGCPMPEDQYCRIYDRRGLFYALYRYDEKADCYKCVKMFRDPPQPRES